MKRNWSFGLVGLGILAISPAFAENFVVVEARGVALKPGAMVDSSKPFVLLQGQHVTLISQSGTTLTLDGPYNKAPAIDKQGVSLGTKLAALTTLHDVRTGEVGTTRGKGAANKLPEPWLIDVTRPGHACLVEGQTLVFWRPDHKLAATLSVMPDDRSWRVNAVWPAGLDRISVETKVPMHSGATYFITFNGTESAISVMGVPAALATNAMRVSWMANKGCEAQAEALARPQK